jgi:hypothetical protein
LFSSTLSLCSSLIVRNWFWQLYKTRAKIILLYILMFKFLDNRQKHKRLRTKW